ncbi:MAG: ParB N-terminal domain-containing protein [Thermoplasmata archaeon]
MVDIIRAYANPEKYEIELPTEKIVADRKIVEDGVSHYHKKIERGQKPRPIIVLKHPREELYAVLDGHHRFWAMVKKGVKNIPSVVVDACTDLGFEMTKKGYFQPSPLFTKHVRIPMKKLAEYMKTFVWNPQELTRRRR